MRKISDKDLKKLIEDGWDVVSIEDNAKLKTETLGVHLDKIAQKVGEKETAREIAKVKDLLTQIHTALNSHLSKIANEKSKDWTFDIVRDENGLIRKIKARKDQ